jgi:hypothetical protein
MPDDKLTAELAGIRRRAEQITSEHGPDDCDLNGETCTGHDAERLLAVVDAVLELHRPEQLYEWVRRAGGKFPCGHDLDRDWPQHFEGADGMTYCRDKPTVVVCAVCADGPANDLMAEWPCKTYLAISTELLGEDSY